MEIIAKVDLYTYYDANNTTKNGMGYKTPAFYNFLPINTFVRGNHYVYFGPFDYLSVFWRFSILEVYPLLFPWHDYLLSPVKFNN